MSPSTSTPAAALRLREVTLHLVVVGAIMVGFFLWFVALVVSGIAVDHVLRGNPGGAWLIVRAAWPILLAALALTFAGRRAARALEKAGPGAA